MLMMQEKYWTPKEIAQTYRVTEATVRRFIREGQIEAVRFGNSLRVSDEALQRFLKQQQDKK